MAQATFSCPFGAIHLEMRWGTPSMNTSPQAGVHRRRPPGPPYYGGRPPEKLLYPPGGPKTRSVLLLATAHWGLRRRKVRYIPDAQVWASVMPLPCSSSPHQTRFAGLWRGPKLSVCAVRTPPTWAKPWQLVRPTTTAPNRKVGSRRCWIELPQRQI